MAAHIKHMITPHESVKVKAVSVTDLWSTVNMLHNAADRMNFRTVLVEFSREGLMDNKVKESGKGLDMKAVNKRVSKAVDMHIGALYAYENGRRYHTLGTYQAQGRIVLASWGRNSLVDPISFLALFEALLRAVHTFSPFSFFPFLVHAVLYLEEERDPDPQRSISLFNTVVGDKYEDVELAQELFCMWERILQVSFCYNETKRCELETAWDLEVSTSLEVPRQGNLVYETFIDWVPIARKLAGGELPSLLCEMARVYFQCHITTVDTMKKNQRVAEILSHIRCIDENHSSPLARDSHLQTVLMCIWESVLTLAQKIRKLVDSHEESEELLQHLVVNLLISAHIQVKNAEIFGLVNRRAWMALNFAQTAKSVNSECEECSSDMALSSDDTDCYRGLSFVWFRNH